MNYHKKKICIINYGIGNIESVKQAFEYMGAEVLVTSDKKKITESTKIVLPGVGAFKPAMDRLKKLEILEIFERIQVLQIPFLGICLGMQLLMDKSLEFGENLGLGLIPGKVIAVPKKNFEKKKLIVPYIGWSKIQYKKNLLTKNMRQKKGFYFIHSYMATTKYKENLIGTYKHHNYNITAIISKNNFYGCQFHPEKSGEDGMALIKNFINIS
jgi:glutamine amidotransferase